MTPMVLKYFHDSVGSGHLGARKTFQKVAAHFWWPKMQAEVFGYVKKCVLSKGQTGPDHSDGDTLGEP